MSANNPFKVLLEHEQVDYLIEVLDHLDEPMAKELRFILMLRKNIANHRYKHLKRRPQRTG